MRVAPGDAVGLARLLVRSDSRNPSLVPGAPGEREVALTLREVLSTWGIHAELQDAAPGRPNVVATVGRGPGRSLLFNGHLDVVGVEGMSHAPFDAFTRNGRLHGRGASDMKSGVAAMCAAAWRAREAGLSGPLQVAAVVDEEFESAGTRMLLDRGGQADACVVTEPTRLAIAPAHRGFTWTEFTVRGRAAHGSRYDLGIDAIRHAGALLAELDRIDREVLPRVTHHLLGHASLHASTIEGGSGWSTYPDRCVIRVERRTLPGEMPADAVGEMDAVCAALAARTPPIGADVRHVFSQLPSDVAIDAPVVVALRDALAQRNESVRIEGVSAWTDAALFNAAGIPAICFGPGDMGMAHADEEWVEETEIERAAEILTRLALDWCGRA
ncbi:MAG TPA: ArgE/DapE family deacylase [Gemmatimonadaceae bacterium]